MNRQWFLMGVIVAVLVGLVSAGWFVRDRFRPVEVGTQAPNFTAVDLQGEPVSLAQLEGEVVLLNIWATWCAPCREEMPSMQRLYERLGPQGLRIVAVSVDAGFGRLDPSGRPGGNIAAFAREMGLTFDIWHDPSGRIQQIYRTTGVPESFVIDSAGYIISKQVGGVEWDSEHRIDLLRRLLER